MPCIKCSHDAVLTGLSRLDGGPAPFPEPGVEPNYARSRSVVIEHVDLALSLEPVERTWRGEARIRVRPLPIHDGVVRFDLDQVTVDAVTGADGEALSFQHADGVLSVKGIDGPAEIVVRWHGASPQRGLHFTGPTAQEPDRQHMAWTQCQDENGHYVFPCHDHPRIKHPWRITLDAPAGYTLLSNGALEDSGERDGRAFATYVQAEPMPAYLLTVVAARLSVHEDPSGPVPVRYLVPEGQEDHVERAMGRTPEMIRVFAERTGVDYPWPRYDQVVVHDFIFGGMENVACTTMIDLLLVDDKAAPEWDPDGLVSHELAHQWFGDLVTCQDWSQAWLNESWATFMEAVWWEHDRAEDEATWYRYGLAQSYLGEDSGRYRRPIVSYRFRDPIDVFDRHLYEKGASVLSTLRFQLGDDAFWTGVNAYLGRHAHGTAHTRHFQRALEDATGANLDRFFDQWIFGAGHPDLEVRLGRDDKLVTVTVTQNQSGDDTAEAFHFPLRLVLVADDGAEQVVELPVRERKRSWAVPVDFDVRTVRVDPGFRVLATIKLAGPRPWLEALLSDPCPVLAYRAARALLDDDAPQAFDAVVRALSEHPWRGTREAIAELLGKRGGDDALDALLAALGTEPDVRVRRAIADALGNFRSARAADALVRIVGGPVETWKLLAVSLRALGRTRDSRAETVITPHLATDSWGDIVRQQALLGLAETEREGVLDTLLTHSRDPWADRVTAAAADALGRLGDKVEDVRTPARERLEDLVRTGGFRTTLAAITALGRLGDPAASGVLEQAHRSAPDGRIRRTAYEALARIRRGRTSEQALGALRRRLEELAEDNAKLRARLDRLERP